MLLSLRELHLAGCTAPGHSQLGGATSDPPPGAHRRGMASAGSRLVQRELEAKTIWTTHLELVECPLSGEGEGGLMYHCCLLSSGHPFQLRPMSYSEQIMRGVS